MIVDNIETVIKMAYYRHGTSLALSVITIALWLTALPAPGSALVYQGNRGGYAMYPKWYACINASISFEFKTSEDHKQLLMYADDGGQYDFFEVLLQQGGKLRVTLNIVDGKDGSVRLSFGNTLNDGRWHKVEIRRNR